MIFNLTANALERKAIKEGIPKLRIQDLAALAKTKPSTYSDWLRDNGNTQVASLVAMFDYLERDKIIEILDEILPKERASIKPALEEHERLQKKRSPKAPPKSATIKLPLPPKDTPRRN
jgi:transcriptional regulator with XRE-family HTH domain